MEEDSVHELYANDHSNTETMGRTFSVSIKDQVGKLVYHLLFFGSSWCLMDLLYMSKKE